VECCIFGRFKGAVFNQHCKNTVWRFPIGTSKEHPTQKPLALFELIINSSSNPNDIVLDPCAGSGTTGVACINTDRRFIQIELSEEYAAIARRRADEALERNRPGRAPVTL
jgi:site-specific DNA-methyltransferase (adenine-specific)